MLSRNVAVTHGVIHVIVSVVHLLLSILHMMMKLKKKFPQKEDSVQCLVEKIGPKELLNLHKPLKVSNH